MSPFLDTCAWLLRLPWGQACWQALAGFQIGKQ